ncbi:hypothetical protein CBS101457_004791 [Exobasidium rhododendri]|nr:hypothetical protein CBS101457_004791 [Exobasidium rhododendri]
MTLSGSCLCGKTTVKVEGEAPQEQIACHCTDCQQSSGSAFSTNILVPQKDVNISGSVAQYDMKAASGNTVSRIFCGNCGSALSHKSKAFGDNQAIQTGSLRQTFSKVPIKTELFVKDRWSGVDAVKDAAQVQAMP